MKKRTVLVLVIALLQGTLGFLLYRQRVVSQAAVWESDLVVFLCPALLAFSAFSWVLWPGSTRPLESSVFRSTARTLGYAAVVTAVASWAYLVIAFNVYGT